MSAHSQTCTCAQCGASTAFLDFGYQLPDCIWEQPAAERAPGNTPDFAVLGERRFVRGLLPLKLESGDEFRYGVWLEIDEATFLTAKEVWNDEARYPHLTFTARVANAAPPWGAKLLGVEVEMAVREMKGRPFVVASQSPWLQHLLANGWATTEYEAVATSLGYR